MGIRDLITGTPSTAVELASINGKPAKSAPYNANRGLTAAARSIDLSSEADAADAADTPWRAWQQEAWEYADAIGEINYGHEMLASIMSRLRLYPAVVVDPDAPPTSTSQYRHIRDEEETEKDSFSDRPELDLPEDLTEEVLEFMETLVSNLGSGYGGIAELLRMFTLNIQTPGECYLAYIDRRWSIRSTSEITVRTADRIPILRESRASNNPRGMPWKELPEKTPLIRIWRQHPRWSREPTSSMIALLEPCEELLTLQRMIRSIARSRMNAGILFIPDGLTVAGQSVSEDKAETEDETEVFVDELFDSMTAPVTDETAGTSVVPMVITGEASLGKEIRWISFARESDQFLVKRADSVLDRILNGLNIPKEKISGLDAVRYSNADVISEDLYKIHIEPPAVMFCDTVTSAYMRTRIKKRFPDLSDKTLARLAIWYDPTDVVIKANPAESATEGYKEFIISGDAWRRAHGFSDADAPSQAEIALRIVVDNIGRNLQPNEQSAVLKQVLPSLFTGQNGDSSGSPLPAQGQPPDRTFGPDDAVSTAEPSGGDAGEDDVETTT